jgi:hypothetical protein
MVKRRIAWCRPAQTDDPATSRAVLLGSASYVSACRFAAVYGPEHPYTRQAAEAADSNQRLAIYGPRPGF